MTSLHLVIQAIPILAAVALCVIAFTGAIKEDRETVVCRVRHREAEANTIICRTRHDDGYANWPPFYGVRRLP
jgi:hypothetical protein